MIWALLGCAAVDPDFTRARADAICARHARCETLTTAGFTSEEACKAALHQAAEDLGAEPLSCDAWSATAAEACLAAYAGPCDAPPELTPCTQVCGPG